MNNTLDLSQIGPAWSTRPVSRIGVPVLLMLVCVPLFFQGLGAVPLLDPDEPYYAIPALEMLDSGTWQVTMFHGEPWFDKPILFYWMILGAYKILGVSEYSARLGSAVSALAGVWCVYALALRMRFGGRGALMAALVLAGSIEYVVLARAAVTDMTLTAALTLGMAAAARYLESERVRWAGLAGVAFGLAVLTKGPVGILIPAVALGAYAVFASRLRSLRPRALLVCVAGAVAVAGPWYLYMAIAHPSLLMQDFLMEGNLGRFLHPEHPKTPWFYLVVLAAGLLPWSGALPAALLRAFRPESRTGEVGPRRPPGRLFALCWFAAVLAIFSLSASKLASYLLPAFPPAAILVAGFWEEWFDNARASRRTGTLAALLGTAVSLLFAAALMRAMRSPPWDGAVFAGALFAAVMVGGSVAALVAVFRRRLSAFLSIQTAVAIVASLVLVLGVGPRVQQTRSSSAFVGRLRGLDLVDQVAGGFGFSEEYSLDYYLRRSLPRIRSRRDLRERVTSTPGSLWIVHGDRVASLREEGFRVDVVANGSRYVAARIRCEEPLPQEEIR